VVAKALAKVVEAEAEAKIVFFVIPLLPLLLLMLFVLPGTGPKVCKIWLEI